MGNLPAECGDVLRLHLGELTCGTVGSPIERPVPPALWALAAVLGGIIGSEVGVCRLAKVTS